MPLLAVRALPTRSTSRMEPTCSTTDTASFQDWLRRSGLVKRDFKVLRHHLPLARGLRDALRGEAWGCYEQRRRGL